MIVITIITYILNIFDLIFTMAYVNKYGIESEANPIGKKAIQNKSVYIVKFVVVGAILTFLYILHFNAIKFASGCLIFLFIVFLALFVYHIVIIYNVYLSYKSYMKFREFIKYFFSKNK